MSFAQKDRLDRIQYTLLPTTEKNFIENERKMPIFDIFFGWQQLMLQPNNKKFVVLELVIFQQKKPAPQAKIFL